jgi:hypothetical protein
MLAGVASCDYQHTNIRAGDPMPTHPCFKRLLPLAVGLYGKRSTLACHHRSRPVAFVPFTTGVSQGDGTGSPFSSLPAHFAAVTTLAHFPNVDVRALSIMDDFHYLAALRYMGPIFVTFANILSDCAGVQLNISKSSLNVLQAATIVDPVAAMGPIYEEFPILEELPLATEGMICVGTPVGHLSFLNRFMEERITVLTQEFQHLLPFPYPHDFLLMVRYCANQKIMHLLRHLARCRAIRQGH